MSSKNTMENFPLFLSLSPGKARAPKMITLRQNSLVEKEGFVVSPNKSVDFLVILFYDMWVKEAIKMSEEALVSPLLDGFVLGAPMSERPGVSCHPAMKENSDQKYIVKVLSMPASQVQLDALLVAGAYSDPAAALDYFRQQADDTAAEAAFLTSMAKLDGFACYE